MSPLLLTRPGSRYGLLAFCLQVRPGTGRGREQTQAQLIHFARVWVGRERERRTLGGTDPAMKAVESGVG